MTDADQVGNHRPLGRWSPPIRKVIFTYQLKSNYALPECRWNHRITTFWRNSFWFYLESIFAAPLHLVTCEQILSNCIWILPLVGSNCVQFLTCFNSNACQCIVFPMINREQLFPYYRRFLPLIGKRIGCSCVSNQMLFEIGFCILCVWGQLINYACVGNWSK